MNEQAVISHLGTVRGTSVSLHYHGCLVEILDDVPDINTRPYGSLMYYVRVLEGRRVGHKFWVNALLVKKLRQRFTEYASKPSEWGRFVKGQGV